MNHVYTVLWNAVLGRYCVASELGRKRSATQRAVRCGVRAMRPTALAALLAMAWAAPGWAALPQGYAVAHGEATINTVGRHMTITQTTHKAILDWQQFNVGKGHQVTFQQPSLGSVVLNRVVGPDHTTVRGNIQSTGNVFLVNPNGVVFSATAKVDVGGLLASSLSISNEDFLAGRYRFSALPDQEQIATVINRGTIRVAELGAVALLGGVVDNSGQIHARRGLVALAAGSMVTLDFNADENLRVVVDEAALGNLVTHKGRIDADGGSVWLTASSADTLLQTVINNTGIIQARTVGEHDGKIRLRAIGETAVVDVAGRLDVSAAQGNGGGIGVEGQQVIVRPGTHISAQADAGEHGKLVVKASQLQVGAEGIDADVLSNALGRNHVHLIAGDGDIQVDAPVAWDQNLLTLDAAQSVHINSTMRASGTSMLAIVHGNGVAGDESIPSDSGLNMALSERGFTGGVEFRDVLDQSDPANLRLAINGDSYTLLTQTGANGSQTGLDLQGINGQLDGNYALAADIDAAGAENFQPIGSSPTPFSGKFEGLGHQISNLNIDHSAQSHVGLFGVSTGSTRNFALKDGSVKGKDRARIVVGSVAGALGADASVANVHTSASVQAHSDQSLSATAIAGSVIGRIDGGTLSNAHALGAARAAAFSQGNLAHAAAGGAVGLVQSGSVTDTHAAGPVTASAMSRRIQYSRDARGAPIFDPGVPPTYTEGTATSYAGGAIGVKSAGEVHNITATGPVSDMSTGSTAVSLHALVGNAPLATRYAANRPQHAALVDAEVPPVVAAISPQPAPAPEAATVQVAASAALQSVANDAPLVESPRSAPGVFMRQASHMPPAANPPAAAASALPPINSMALIDAPASQASASVQAVPMALPVDTVAPAADRRAAVEMAAANVARSVPVVAHSAAAADIAAAKPGPDATPQALPGSPPSETRPRMRIQSLPTYAAVMSSIGSLARADSAPAQSAASEEPLYTVIGGGIHRPAR